MRRNHTKVNNAQALNAEFKARVADTVVFDEKSKGLADEGYAVAIAVPNAFAEPLAPTAPTQEQAAQMIANVDAVFAAMDNEDLDIPAEALKPEPLKLWQETIVATGDPNALYESWPIKAPPVYRWEIPLDAFPGYVLPIEVTEAASVEHARDAALVMVVGGDGTEENPGRELTPMERAWLKSEEPMIVRDTTQVTLGHERALHDNEALTAKIAELEGVSAALSAFGINAEDPQSWIDAQKALIDQLARTTQERFKYDRQQLANSLENAIEALRQTAKQTGFAQPDPVLPPEPDYSALTVVAPQGLKPFYPKLQGANWTEFSPFDEPSETERAGLYILLNDNDGLASEYIRRSASFEDQAKMRAAVARVKALLGE
jgi:hypothetical protein